MNIKTLLTEELFVNTTQSELGQYCSREEVIAGRAIAKTKRVIAEWLMNYIDINLEEIIPDDKYTLFFIPNDKLKAIKKWALGE